jgi:Animal haem peroxidase
MRRPARCVRFGLSLRSYLVFSRRARAIGLTGNQISFGRAAPEGDWAAAALFLRKEQKMPRLFDLLRYWCAPTVRMKPTNADRLGLKPSLESLEIRCLMTATAMPNTGSMSGGIPVAAAVRSIDGTGNNLTNPTWGSAGIDLLRKAAAAYGDGISSLAGTDRPSSPGRSAIPSRIRVDRTS